MKGAALVLSVVDARTEMLHLVAVDVAALHRRSGRYPALCDREVLSASMLTEPSRHCEDCQTRSQEGAARRADHRLGGRRRRSDTREGSDGE